MRTDNEEKNNKIVQLESKLNENKAGKNKEIVTRSEKKDEGGDKEREEREKEREKEEQNRKKCKCYWHEKSKCKRDECTFRHPTKVCRDYNKNGCEKGKYCDNNHPRKKCTYWLRGVCNKGDSCTYSHADNRRENERKNTLKKKTNSQN